MAVDQNVRAAAADAEGHVNPLVGDVAVAAVGFERRIKGDGVYVTRNSQSAHKLMKWCARTTEQMLAYSCSTDYTWGLQLYAIGVAASTQPEVIRAI